MSQIKNILFGAANAVGAFVVSTAKDMAKEISQEVGQKASLGCTELASALFSNTGTAFVLYGPNQRGLEIDRQSNEPSLEPTQPNRELQHTNEGIER